MNLTIPATVPHDKYETYKKNYKTITHGTDRLFLFAADQKIEHLNKDFFGPGLPQEINNPEHVFSIASQSKIGVFATHLGLINRYGAKHKNVPYCAKLDGKTNLSKGEPYSKQIWTVQDAVNSATNADLNICAVGYTVYVGSEYEREMLTEAATIVKNAHAAGLIAILWMYPRGGSIKNEKNEDLIAGAAGLGASLGADFVKVNEPESGPSGLKQAVQAAGNSKVIVAGGAARDPEDCIQMVKQQLELGGTAGGAIGRNIFQHSLKDAIDLSNKLSELIYKT